MKRALVTLLAAAAAAVIFGLALARGTVAAQPGITIGVLASGPNDAITDVAGVRVGNVTKIEGAAGPLVPGVGPVRTGVTVVLPNEDPWMQRVAAASLVLNGNGEMTGTHWIDEAGFLEEPIALTNTLDVAHVDDGVIDWLIRKHPEIGVDEDVPLPVVAECDDQGINDIQGRHVSARDTVAALDAAAGGPFARGNVGAGTGMRAFGFKGGIGTASRIADAGEQKYTVGILLNANTGSRSELKIDGVPIGSLFAHELLPTMAKSTAAYRPDGRAADGSVVVALATDAPLEARQIKELLLRAVLGLARTGLTSHTSSGDLLVGFSTTHRYDRDPKGPQSFAAVNSDETMDALFAATAEATEAAVDDALFSGKTLEGARGLTYYGLPVDRVRRILDAAKVSLPSKR